MDLIGILVLLAFIFNISLAAFIHFRSSRKQSDVIFEIAVYAVAFWAISMFFYRLVGFGTSLVWARILYSAASLIAPSFFLFSLYFPKERSNKPTLILIAFWTIFLMTITMVPDILVRQVIISLGHEKRIIFGPLYSVYLIHIVGFFTAFYFNMLSQYKLYRATYSLIRMQIQYVLIGITAASIVAMITNLLLPSIGYFDLNWAGQVTSTLGVGVIAYAIIRHRLMDIRLVAARTIAYVILLTTIAVFYISAAFFVSSIFITASVGREQLLIYTGLTLFVAFTFEKLKTFIERMTDKILFKGRYDANQLLGSLSSIMSTNIELLDLTTKILSTLVTEMRITRGALVLLENKKIDYIIGSTMGFRPNFTYSQLNVFLTYQEIIVFDELEEGEVKQQMRDLDIAAAKVLRVEDKVMGLLVLGEKASGDIYSEQDVNVLNILASEVAVAIQNSKLFEQVKQFNIVLKQEVDKATSDLQLANLKLKELDHLKDDFVSVASHELRTPLTAIRSYAWMALNRSDVPLSEKMKRYLGRTVISTERLINLVNEMLNISRIESGRVEIQPEVFSISESVKDVLDEVGVRASERLLNLKLGDSSAIPRVFADRDKVHQVLLNLIGNALKFTPAGGTIEVSFGANASVVGVAVKDSGTGIAKEDLPRLFKKFGRLDNSYVIAGTSGGTGLGLYVCKSLLELMGGEIWATSEGVGKGSTFYFTLPVASKEALSHADRYHHVPQGEVKGLEPVAI